MTPCCGLLLLGWRGWECSLSFEEALVLLFEESVHVCLHVRVEETAEHVVVMGHLKESRECNGTRSALAAFSAAYRIEEFESFLAGRDRSKLSLCSKKRS